MFKLISAAILGAAILGGFLFLGFMVRDAGNAIAGASTTPAAHTTQLVQNLDN